jgi:hypothetical protein
MPKFSAIVICTLFTNLRLPERLEKRVREAKEDHVVHRPLAEIMVDAIDVILVERAEQDGVELARRRKVVPEGLLHDHARTVGAAALRELQDNGAEKRRRDREVVRRTLRLTQLLLDRLKRRAVVVIAADVAQEAGEPVERRGVEMAVLLDALSRSRPQLLEIPVGLGHADHRRVELPALHEREERREDLLEGEISARPEKNQCIGSRFAHAFLARMSLFRVGFSTWPPNSKRIADRACPGTPLRRAS